MPAAPNKTIAFMKGSLSSLVYSSVQIEGIGATFAQTRTIVEDGLAAGLSSRDVGKIVALKHAWQHLFAHGDDPITRGLYSRYNELLGAGNVPSPGTMRGPGEVCVGDFVPPDDIDEGYFDRIVQTAVATSHDDGETACVLFLQLARAQFFYDGNKRAAQLLANHFLAREDSGLAFIVREETRDDVLDVLVDFYARRLSCADAAWDVEELCIRSVEDGFAAR